jgi:hypothetical protein
MMYNTPLNESNNAIFLHSISNHFIKDEVALCIQLPVDWCVNLVTRNRMAHRTITDEFKFPPYQLI